MNIKCQFEKRLTKDGKKDYYVLYIPDIEKVVFLSDLEVKMLNLLFSK